MNHLRWTTLLCSLALGACSSLQNNETNYHDAMCNQLKHQIVFNGVTTANQTTTTAQKAQLDKANQSYNQMGC